MIDIVSPMKRGAMCMYAMYVQKCSNLHDMAIGLVFSYKATRWICWKTCGEMRSIIFYDMIDGKFCPEAGLLVSRCVAQARGVSVYGMSGVLVATHQHDMN
jgi:hypothetical protein